MKPVVIFQSAIGLAHSKTWRTYQRPRRSRSVLDCGSPLPLFFREPPWEPGPWQMWRTLAWAEINAVEAKEKTEGKQP